MTKSGFNKIRKMTKQGLVPPNKSFFMLKLLNIPLYIRRGVPDINLTNPAYHVPVLTPETLRAKYLELLNTR
jgi:hypothetical protein